FQPLLAEAEALDLVEVLPRLERRHVEGGLADDGARGRICRLVEGQRRLADMHLDLALCWLELPGHAAGGVGIEADRYEPLAHLGRRRLRRLRRAPVTGDLAEQPV